MAHVIKLRKGLDISLKGRASEERLQLKSNGKFALTPDDFVGVVPKVVVKEGDVVKAGEALFVNKQFPEVAFASPVSGRVTAVERGDRRKVLCVRVEADKEQQKGEEMFFHNGCFWGKDMIFLAGKDEKYRQEMTQADANAFFI